MKLKNSKSQMVDMLQAIGALLIAIIALYYLGQLVGINFMFWGGGGSAYEGVAVLREKGGNDVDIVVYNPTAGNDKYKQNDEDNIIWAEYYDYGTDNGGCGTGSGDIRMSKVDYNGDGKDEIAIACVDSSDDINIDVIDITTAKDTLGGTRGDGTHDKSKIIKYETKILMDSVYANTANYKIVDFKKSDLNGDGKDELLVAFSGKKDATQSHRCGYIVLVDPANGVDQFISKVESCGTTDRYIEAFATGDVNGDGNEELIVIADNDNDDRNLYIYNMYPFVSQIGGPYLLCSSCANDYYEMIALDSDGVIDSNGNKRDEFAIDTSPTTPSTEKISLFGYDETSSNGIVTKNWPGNSNNFCLISTGDYIKHMTVLDDYSNSRDALVAIWGSEVSVYSSGYVESGSRMCRGAGWWTDIDKGLQGERVSRIDIDEDGKDEIAMASKQVGGSDVDLFVYKPGVDAGTSGKDHWLWLENGNLDSFNIVDITDVALRKPTLEKYKKTVKKNVQSGWPEITIPANDISYKRSDGYDIPYYTGIGGDDKYVIRGQEITMDFKIKNDGKYKSEDFTIEAGLKCCGPSFSYVHEDVDIGSLGVGLETTKRIGLSTAYMEVSTPYTPKPYTPIFKDGDYFSEVSIDDNDHEITVKDCNEYCDRIEGYLSMSDADGKCGNTLNNPDPDYPSEFCVNSMGGTESDISLCSSGLGGCNNYCICYWDSSGAD